MTKDILFVLEGGRTEPRFLKALIRSTRDDRDYSVFSYGTSLHKMLEGMFEGGDIDTDLDFQEYLKSCRTGSGGDVLDRTFTDIFLMFDMDPQDQNFDSRRVRKALDYFDDSTENGKMYINYPMLESYKHIAHPDDSSYLDERVSVDDINHYKEMVGKEGDPALADVGKILPDMWRRIIDLNLMKANLLVN